MAASMIRLLWDVLAGTLLGSLYFGGLWLSIRQIAQWRHAGLAMAASQVLRLAIVAMGLYLVAGRQWQSYLAALLGILVARWVWIRRIGPRLVSRS